MARPSTANAATATLLLALVAAAAVGTPAAAHKPGGRSTCGAPFSLIDPQTGTQKIINADAEPTFRLRETFIATSPSVYSEAPLGTPLTGTFGLFDEDGDEVGYAVLSGTVVNKPNNDPNKSIINEVVTYVFLKPVGGKRGGKTFGPGSLVTTATVLNSDPTVNVLILPVVAGQGNGFCTAGGSGVVVFEEDANNKGLRFYL